MNSIKYSIKNQKLSTAWDTIGEEPFPTWRVIRFEKDLEVRYLLQQLHRDAAEPYYLTYRIFRTERQAYRYMI